MCGYFKLIMKKNCCDEAKRGANHKSSLTRVNRIKGQVEGIARMIDEQAYCPEIITQIQAARSALASLQATLLSGHLSDCVAQGIKKGSSADSEILIKELLTIFKHT